MEFPWIITLTISLTITIFIKLIKKNPSKNLPPGPQKLPLLGNLHQLASKTTLPHQRLAELARVHGPIMHLQLGQVPTVVISSSEMAKEALKTNDSALCSRPNLLTPEVIYYKSSDIALAPYGEYWRQVRKIATLELFTARRVHGFHSYREEAIMDFFQSMLPLVKAGSVINLSSKLFNLSFDIMLRLAINKKAKDGEAFRKLVADTAELSSGFSIGDLYPSLKFISSISGMKAKLQRMVTRMDNIMDPIIEEHIINNKHNEEDGDLVDILLNYYKDDNHLHNKFHLTKDNIKAIVFELFGAGGETSSTIIDWTIAELLKNPRVMKKAQNEVRQVLQENIIMVDKSSLEKLTYLKCIIKETLRLHPPVPCLVPRESMKECKINGYDIPLKTRVFVNAWAIGRNPECWKDPEKFDPERFVNSSIDYKGNNFELIPFGAGRRICPGMGLGIATVELVLAMLLYHFDWKLPHGIKQEDIDMNEAFGIIGRRKMDLEVIPVLQPFSGFK
ncbi:unnamed protein product [Amaranthus hypochondriacus]